MRFRRAAVAVLAVLLLGAGAAAAQARIITLGEYTLSSAKLDTLRSLWISQLERRYGYHVWAPMKFDLGDRELELMGLPSKKVLTSHRYATPTAVVGGRLVPLARLDSYLAAHAGAKAAKAGGGGTTAAGPSVISFAGTGWFGIRPGAWLLTITDQEVGWCSMAHVYGSPGAYEISTAGHCGKAGDVGTVIGVVGNKTFMGQPIPVLIDFGKYVKSTGDAGIGKDWALIGVSSAYQNLVSPTMAFWGGPIGMFRATGETVSADLTKGSVSTNTNPFLVQQIVHYGHGAGIGTGGTPRSGTSIAWYPDRFVFFGAITPGDSGSGSNTVLGDAIGAERQAAGINTHIYVDASLRTGIGYLAGTRATQVGATLHNGQLIPTPVPEAITP